MRRTQNLKKNPTCFDKTAVFTQQCQNKREIFFQIFVAFSEKLNFKEINKSDDSEPCSSDFLSRQFFGSDQIIFHSPR